MMEIRLVFLLLAVFCMKVDGLEFNVTATTSNITVTWDAISDVANFTIYINGTKEHDVLNPSVGSNYVKYGLDAGTEHTVEINKTHTDDTVVSAFKETIITKPEPPTGVTVIATSTTELSVAWTAGANSIQDSFKVTYDRTSEGNGHTEVTSCTTSGCIFTVAAGFHHGEQFEVKVYAVKAPNILSTAATGTGYTIPNSPTGVTVTPVSTTELSVAWTAGVDSIQDSFKVTYDKTGGNNHTTATSCTTTTTTSSCTFAVTGFSAGEEFEVKVYAVRGTDIESTAATGTGYTIPNPPTAVIVTPVSTNELSVAWTAGTNSIQDTYLVKYYEQEGTSTNAVNVTGCTPSGCEFTVETNYLPGQAFTILVYAVQNAVILSTPGTGNGYTNPNPLTDSAITVKTRATESLTLEWNKPTDTQSDSFRVVVTSPTNGVLGTGSFNDQNEYTYTQTGLNPGHQYNFTVYTVVGTGDSAVESVAVSKSFYTTPLPPSGVVLDTDARSTDSLTITWPAPTNTGFTTFGVTVTPSGGQSQPEVVQTGTTYARNGLTPGTQYTFEVTSIVSGDIHSQAATVVFYTIPLPPTGVAIHTRATTSITIKWPTPATTVTGFSSFRVEVTPNHGLGDTSQQGLDYFYNRTGLTAGTQYTFKVYSVVQVDGTPLNSQPTTDVPLYTKPPTPGAPTRGETTINSLTVTWMAPPEGNFVQYSVSLKETGSNTDLPGSGSPVVVLKDATLRTATFDSLTAGQEYSVSIVTVVGTDIESDAVSKNFRIKPNPVASIGAPTERTTSRLVVPFTVPANIFTGFKVQLKDVDSSDQTLQENVRQAIFSNLVAGTRYTVEVFAVSGDQMSDVTTAHYYTKPNPPRTLVEVADDLSNTTLGVSWTVPESGDYDNYKITIQPQGGTGTSETVARTITKKKKVPTATLR